MTSSLGGGEGRRGAPTSGHLGRATEAATAAAAAGRRGRVGAQHTTSASRRRAPRASRRGRVPRACRRRGCRSPATANSSSSVLGQRPARPSGLCAPSSTTQRVAADDLEPARERARRRTPRRPVARRAAARRTPRPRRARWRRCRPGGRRARAGTRRRRTRPACAARAAGRRRRAGSRCSRSRRRAATRSGAGRRRRSATQLGIGLAEHERAARLHDAGLLLGDVGAASARGTSVWSRPTLVTTATCAVDDVGGVPATDRGRPRPPRRRPPRRRTSGTRPR